MPEIKNRQISHQTKVFICAAEILNYLNPEKNLITHLPSGLYPMDKIIGTPLPELPDTAILHENAIIALGHLIKQSHEATGKEVYVEVYKNRHIKVHNHVPEEVLHNYKHGSNFFDVKYPEINWIKVRII